jgi:hypothetical protein
MITVMAVFEFLLLVASPILLLVELCIVWCSGEVAHWPRRGDRGVRVEFELGGRHSERERPGLGKKDSGRAIIKVLRRLLKSAVRDP